MNEGSKAKLSVVVAASHDTSSLERCLLSLQEQRNSASLEVIVATNFDDGAAEMIRSRFPRFVHLDLPADTTVPELRSHGIAHASGEVVAITEDNCIADQEWCSEIGKAHELSYSIIGGSVDNAASSRHIDWAVYFYEYGKYMPPNRAGVVSALPGNNVSYKRSVLDGMQESFQGGFYETFVHQRLAKTGQKLYMAPSAIVRHCRSYSFNEAVAQCYHHGRSFAAMRAAGATALRRAALVLGSPLLPVLLPSRIAAGVVKKRRHVGQLLLCLPQLVVLMTSWSWGEFLGYLRGAGDSARRWK
ncbi:MAG: glycosyltransferase [bacterium]|nr:glycosyltransferase [bacterium]